MAPSGRVRPLGLPAVLTDMLPSSGDISRGIALSHTTRLRWVMRYVPEF
jgi:hypothetical protein